MGYGGTGRLREVEAPELSKCEYISILFAHLNRVVMISWRSIRDMNGLLSYQRECVSFCGYHSFDDGCVYRQNTGDIIDSWILYLSTVEVWYSIDSEI